MGHGGDEEQERQQRETVAAEFSDAFGQLADIERLWVELVGPLGPARSERQVEALLPRVAELFELTYSSALVHPSERPLRPLLERCPAITGEWELDTQALTLELVGSALVLPLLPVPRGPNLLTEDDGEGTEDDRFSLGLGTRVVLSQPPGPSAPLDALGIVLVHDGAFASQQHWMQLDLTELADAVRTHLVDALPSSTVLSRTSTQDHGQRVGTPTEDRDVDAARSADRLVDLYAGLEHALVRGAAGGRGPDGGAVTDGEVTHRRGVLLDATERVRVTVHQSLPGGTVEPVRLAFRATTGEDPDGFDVLPLTYDLQLDLTEQHRGEGLLGVSSWTGTSQRAVLLPHAADCTTRRWSRCLTSRHPRVNATPKIRWPRRCRSENFGCGGISSRLRDLLARLGSQSYSEASATKSGSGSGKRSGACGMSVVLKLTWNCRRRVFVAARTSAVVSSAKNGRP